MATIKGCNTRFIVGGYDLSGETNAVGLNILSRAISYAVLQDCDERLLPLTPQGAIEQKGYYTGPAAGSLEANLFAYLGHATGVHVANIYDTAGSVPFAYIQSKAYNSKWKADAKSGALLLMESMWPTLKGSGARMYRGYQVYGGIASATGALTGIDLGAAGSAGGKLFVFVTSITGTATNATIKLQSDTDIAHGTTADEGTATFSAIGCQEVTLTGTVNRYQRMNVTSLGGATDFTFYAISCIDGVTF